MQKTRSLLLAVAALCLGTAVFAAGTKTEIQTDDGWMLSADYVPAAHGKLTAVLLHGLGSDRGEWRIFESSLTAAGIGYLAFDMRGHGESTVSITRISKYTDKGWQPSDKDLKAVMRFLKEKHIKPADIYLVGASIGANMVLDYAADSPKKFRAVVLLSPGLDYMGVQTEKAVKKLRETPLLIAAAKSDAYSLASSRVLADKAFLSSKVAKPVLLEPAKGHGVNIFTENGEQSADFLEKIINWMSRL